MTVTQKTKNPIVIIWKEIVEVYDEDGCKITEASFWYKTNEEFEKNYSLIHQWIGSDFSVKDRR